MPPNNKEILHIGALTAMIGGGACAVETMQRLGSDTHGPRPNTLMLPRCDSEATLAITQAWGFVWPKDTPLRYERRLAGRHELLLPVETPPAWTTKSTGHWLYKKLVDPQGQVRAELMIHFQDQDARLTLERKYQAGSWQANYDEALPAWPVIRDSSDNILWTGEPLPAYPNYRKDWNAYLEKLGAHSRSNSKKPEPAEPLNTSRQAKNIAQALLQTLLPDEEARQAQALFDTPIEFPASTGAIPTMLRYTVYTEFRHNPHDQYAADSGSEPLLAKDDAEAETLFDQKFKERASGYHIKATLRDAAGKTVTSYSDTLPARQRGGPRGQYCEWNNNGYTFYP